MQARARRAPLAAALLLALACARVGATRSLTSQERTGSLVGVAPCVGDANPIEAFNRTAGASSSFVTAAATATIEQADKESFELGHPGETLELLPLEGEGEGEGERAGVSSAAGEPGEGALCPQG
jgi:hypothetical protein